MDINIRRSEDLLCGRLVALPSTTTLSDLKSAQAHQGYRNVISVDFPAMPDTIELARSADYAVNSNMVLPDGVHQYRGTKPLEIPFSFKLHALDDQFCKEGALSILQLAARLHSFVLPISTYSGAVNTVPSAPVSGAPTAAAQEGGAGSADQGYEVSSALSGQGSLYCPVTCWLHLMWVGLHQPGISCIGYVKDVRVVFSGPWLRGPNNSHNLPSSAEYSFTFMHRPGHGNSMPFTGSNGQTVVANTPQTFADDVKDKFYNTRDLVAVANYQGFRTGSFTDQRQ